MRSNAAAIRARISQMCSHFTFRYGGQSCGVDPLSSDHFDMWWGDSICTVDSIDEVMSKPFFNGNSLEGIAEQIDIIDW